MSQIIPELVLSVSRSSGPGGQHVNKVNTKVILKFDVLRSRVLSNEDKELVARRLSSRLTRDGAIVLTAQNSRSLEGNRATALRKLEEMLVFAFKKEKKRMPTKPTKSSIHKRLSSKKKHSEKKKMRSRGDGQ